MEFRKETDTMGTVFVPRNSFFGPQTQRAIENFPISGLTFPVSFIHALALVKKCAALVNELSADLPQRIQSIFPPARLAAV